MKGASWKDCIEYKQAYRVTPDKGKIKSLIEISKDRIEVLEIKVNEKTVNYVFEDYYSSVLELLQSLMLAKGYKARNHICLGFFLRDVMERDDLFRVFDDCRFKRNSLVYYGKRMEFEVAKDALKKIKNLMGELNKIIENLKW